MGLKRIALHFICWLAYLLFETYFEFAWISSSFAQHNVWGRWMIALKGESVLLLAKIPFTYFTLYVINTLSGKWRNPFLTVGAIVLGLVAGSILHRLLIIHVILPEVYNEHTGEDLIFDLRRTLSSFLNVILIVGLFVATNQYWLYRHSRENEKLLLKEKLEAELMFLRTQMNPHFLFNTLNNIYALSRKQSAETPDAIMKLSKLLRFMLYESKNNFITIADELRIMNDYIELQRIRYNERLTITFNSSIDNESEPIGPLILLPFVENSFKHGASETRFESFISIDIILKNGQLTFICENSKDDERKSPQEDNIGLRNIKRQLQLMYQEHSLTIDNLPGLFKISLQINLKKHASLQLPGN